MTSCATIGTADPRRQRPDRQLDSADSHHARAVDDVDQADRAGRELLTPASDFSEALVAFARAGRVTDAGDAIAGMGIAVVAFTAPIASGAAELRARHDTLRLPDALVLATADGHAGALLTYDQRLARTARQRRKR